MASQPTQADLFGLQAQTSPTYGQWAISINSELTFPLRNGRAPLLITQNSHGRGELGSRVWNAALVLSRFVEKLNLPPNTRMLELGSGTGLVGLVAAACGYGVTLTDQSTLLPLLRHNSSRNGLTTEVLECNWNAPASVPPFDVLLGADLTYDYDDLMPLANTMRLLCKPGGVAYIAYGVEREATPTFFKHASQWFTVADVPEAQLETQDITSPSFTIAIAKLTRNADA